MFWIRDEIKGWPKWNWSSEHLQMASLWLRLLPAWWLGSEMEHPKTVFQWTDVPREPNGDLVRSLVFNDLNLPQKSHSINSTNTLLAEEVTTLLWYKKWGYRLHLSIEEVARRVSLERLLRSSLEDTICHNCVVIDDDAPWTT